MCKEIVQKTIVNSSFTDTVEREGYVVQIGNEKVITFEDFNEKEIYKYRKTMKGGVLETRLDGNKVYIYTVEIIKNKIEAMRIAKERNQFNILELETGFQIFVQ